MCVCVRYVRQVTQKDQDVMGPRSRHLNYETNHKESKQSQKLAKQKAKVKG